MGSALQCRACKHVRPIQNAPFLDIPVVPTAVSAYLASAGTHRHPGDPPRKHAPTSFGPPCRLEHCLEEFTSVERVQDVECRSCTLLREISALEEETAILRGAVEALRMKAEKRKNGDKFNNHQNGGDDPGKHLRRELEITEAKLASLRAVCPDEDDAIERVLASESLSDDDPPLHLKIQRSQAFKCLLLTRLPSVLCIHIQRRFYDPDTNRMSKTAQHVVFPEYLDVGPYCAYGAGVGPDAPWAGTPSTKARRGSKTPITFRLVSAVEHCGGAFYGHYVAYRRDPVSDQWLYINDDAVKAVDWKAVQSCQAYMLFYEAL